MRTRLAARGINYAYPGSAQLVVQQWSQDFQSGQVSALTGPSGCGKSTRLYLLALMVRARGGQVLLDGERVDQLPDAALSRLRAARFGFVFQDAALDPTRTVLDNVLESALYRGQDARKLAPRAYQLVDRLGVQVPVHRRPGQISGGQAQRIALCRALLGSPDVIIADEPTGNLDPASADAVLQVLRDEANSGACVIVVTHDPVVRNWADVAFELGSLMNVTEMGPL